MRKIGIVIFAAIVLAVSCYSMAAKAQEKTTAADKYKPMVVADKSWLAI